MYTRDISEELCQMIHIVRRKTIIKERNLDNKQNKQEVCHKELDKEKCILTNSRKF